MDGGDGVWTEPPVPLSLTALDERRGSGLTEIVPEPTFRLLLGLSDPEQEQRLLAALDDEHGFTVAGRCLSADDLLPQVGRMPVDVALLSGDLHHLSRGVVSQLRRQGPRVVLLLDDRGDEAAWRDDGVALLPVNAEPAVVAAALRGQHPAGLPARADLPEDVEGIRSEAPATDSLVVAITGGHGSPGRTTVAVSLAASLGSVAPTVLVDADLSGPSIAAFLDVDPTRNLYMLAHAAPASTLEWDRALEQELQPLGSASRQAFVLCGVPKLEMRHRISLAFFVELLTVLGQRFRYVVVDTGGGLGEGGGEIGRWTVESAGRVLLVMTPDLVGLAHTRRLLASVRQEPLAAERMALVVNRYHRRHHPKREELEWALDVRLAAIVPYDYHAAERALIAQRPLVLDRRSPAGRALLDMAGRLHDGEVVLSPDVPRARGAQAAYVVRRLPSWKRRRVSSPVEGATDGHLAGVG